MSGHTQRPGDYRVICDFSGFKCWASETVKTFNGSRVLARFAGEETQRHPQENVRSRPDLQSVPWSRPEGTDVFLSVGDVSAADL
jgi:hypothetical protein